MLLNNYEQQLSVNSFNSKSVDLSRELLRRDELSEIIANMTKTLHVNTPELTMQATESVILSETDDDQQQQLIDQLQAQLIQNQTQRTRPRNYSRILNQSSTPARWYEVPPVSRSVYFYDPNYQKYAQKRTYPPTKIKPNIRASPSQSRRNQERSINQSNLSIHDNSSTLTPRTKYVIDLYQTALNYQQKHKHYNPNVISSNVSQQNLSNSSRLQTVPTLPSIHSSKQQKENLQSTQTNRPSMADNSRKRIDPVSMPPTS